MINLYDYSPYELFSWFLLLFLVLIMDPILKVENMKFYF